jgi:hypothetical protein
VEWIDEANRQLAAIKAREKLIVEQEDDTYEGLWNELKTHIEAAKAAGFPRLFTNGRDHARVVVHPGDIVPGMPESSPAKLNLTLSKNDHTITASHSWDDPGVAFHVDVCSDGFVCLKFEGGRISNKEAAIRILWPFLYPDLPPYDGPKPTTEARVSFAPRMKIPKINGV